MNETSGVLETARYKTNLMQHLHCPSPHVYEIVSLEGSRRSCICFASHLLWLLLKIGSKRVQYCSLWDRVSLSQMRVLSRHPPTNQCSLHIIQYISTCKCILRNIRSMLKVGMAFQSLYRAITRPPLLRQALPFTQIERAIGHSGTRHQAEPQVDLPAPPEEPRWLRELGIVRNDWT